MNSRLDTFSIIALLLIILSIVLTYGERTSWISHALAGMSSMVVMIIAIALGAMMVRRIKKIEGNLYGFHKKASIIFGSFILGAFFYELLLRLQHHRPIMHSIHGRFSLVIVFILLFQIFTSLVFQKKGNLRLPHKVLGYLLAPLVILDVILGLYSKVEVGNNNLALIHSISGGLAALALIWIVIEMRYLTYGGLSRARIASYLTTLCIIAGCWIVGGINYRTSYGIQIRPVILASSTPWAHSIIMETKEHIFLFLPVIVLCLSLTLSFIDEATLMKSPPSRRAITLLSLLAIFMVLLMFLMGAIVSNAGKVV
jgi:hypothetical protein